MRTWTLVALLISVGGCLGGEPVQDAAAATGQAFTAEYDVLWSISPPPLHEPLQPGEANGHLALRLAPEPVQVAGADLVARPAFALTVELTSDLSPETATEPLMWSATYHVVAGQVLRVEFNCEAIESLLAIRYSCGEADHGAAGRNVFWGLQGLPLPLGIGWDRAGALTVPTPTGDLQTVAFAADPDGAWSLAPGALLPNDVLYDPAGRYVYDDASGLPARMQVRLASHSKYVVRADRVSFEAGAALPKVPPFEARVPTELRPSPTMPGLQEDAFGSTVSFQDGFDRLFAAGADKLVGEGCLLEAWVGWGGGTRAGLPAPVLDTDALVFWMFGAAANGAQQTEDFWVTHQTNPVSVVRPEWSDVTHRSNVWPAVECLPAAFPIQTPHEFLVEAWQVPTTASGAPCDVGFQGRPWRRADAYVYGPNDLFARPSPEAADNDPDAWDEPVPGQSSGSSGVVRAGHHVVKDTHTGQWLRMLLQPEDVVALDQGAAATPRPLPEADTVPVPTGAPYRCVPSTQD